MLPRLIRDMRQSYEGTRRRCSLAVSTKHVKFLFSFGHAPPSTQPPPPGGKAKRNSPSTLRHILPELALPSNNVPLGSSCPFPGAHLSSDFSPPALLHRDLPACSAQCRLPSIWWLPAEIECVQWEVGRQGSLSMSDRAAPRSLSASMTAFKALPSNSFKENNSGFLRKLT